MHVADDQGASPTTPRRSRKQDPSDRSRRFRSNPRGRDRSTRLDSTAFRAFRPDRGLAQGGLENPLMLALEEHPDELLSYPAQSDVTLPLRRAAARAGRAEHLALWAGQAAALARPIGAAELLSLLVDETTRSLSRAG
ncbi:MAG TPA: nitronate monooxygenase [Kofleriaceae bacterium]|nr:nitronate monooxygenase [Kofleriaceae bacterium]